MVTRKAILGAFEVITNDKNVKTVTVFVNTNGLVKNIERVRVTRIFKNQQDFRVQLGKPNYKEFAFIRKQRRELRKIKYKVQVKEF